ncbi:MAG TPA: hypothetical protein VLA16_27085 [Ideonella sp.]|nr:hypothetical protein [Ideonella sp.]
MSKGLWQIFKWPAALALVTAIGLVSALVADGVWDSLSWLGLGLPVAVGLWFAFRRAPDAAAPR